MLGHTRPCGEATWAFLPLRWDLPEWLKLDVTTVDLTPNRQTEPLAMEDK